MENQNNQNHLNISNKEDKLFATQFESVKAFAFDQQVTDVFADMIKRSVPGYDLILKSIAMYCMKYAKENTTIYDLGCSLGAVAVTAALATENTQCDIVAVDTSVPMIEKCQKIVNTKNLGHRISVLNQNIESLKIEDASVVVSNFTLQFIPKKQRQKIVKNIYQGLKPGGVFILSEKITSDEDDEFMIKHYHAYKKLNGYSNKEIQRKRKALIDVLVPDTEFELENRLKLAGFNNIIKWFQCFNFASFIAIKN